MWIKVSRGPKENEHEMRTGEVVELVQRLHDDRDERQVELSHVGSDLRLSVARV